MKISVGVSVSILAVGALLGWHDHQQLANSRATRDKLAAEAARLGIPIDRQNSGDGVRLTKRGERGNEDAEARLVARDFVVFAKEMEAAEKKGGPPDEGARKGLMAFLDRLISLNAGQLKTLIAEIKASKDLTDESRRGLISFSIMSLAHDHPQAALALLFESSTDSSGVFRTDGAGKQAIATSLANWAKNDPMGALDWVKKNGGRYPALTTESARLGMLSGTAANDPKLAFQLIGELGLKENAVRMIVDAAKTPDERTATWAAFHEHLASLPEGEARQEALKGGVLSSAAGAAKEGFEAGSQWIANAGFTPEQLAILADTDFPERINTEDTGKWIEWMSENLPEGKANGDIRGMIRQWTVNDYQAAGKWLLAAPDGPVKEISVRSYAETVARYEPQTAARWAMTLPPGKDRDETLKNIHGAWPENDAAAREAFAKQYGFK